MSQKAVVLVNGGVFSQSYLLKYYRPEEDYLVCCDGAANHLYPNTAYIPDAVIGDLDSINSESRAYFSEHSQLMHKPSQYQCDLEKAMDHCIEQGFKDVTLLNLEGGRMDYTLANFIMLVHYAKKINLHIGGTDYQAWPVVKHFERALIKNQKLSLVPIGTCTGVSLKGLHYPLTDADFKLGSVGVSNVVVGDRVQISMKSGFMWCFVLEADDEG